MFLLYIVHYSLLYKFEDSIVVVDSRCVCVCVFGVSSGDNDDDDDDDGAVALSFSFIYFSPFLVVVDDVVVPLFCQSCCMALIFKRKRMLS